MAKPTNEQLAEAASLGLDVDGRLSSATLAKRIAEAKAAADAEDAAQEALIASQTPDELEQLERQMAAETKPATLLVYLDYDTWIDDVRIKADPTTPQELPRDRARELLAIGKARRADPLPGDD